MNSRIRAQKMALVYGVLLSILGLWFVVAGIGSEEAVQGASGGSIGNEVWLAGAGIALVGAIGFFLYYLLQSKKQAKERAN